MANDLKLDKLNGGVETRESGIQEKKAETWKETYADVISEHEHEIDKDIHKIVDNAKEHIEELERTKHFPEGAEEISNNAKECVEIAEQAKADYELELPQPDKEFDELDLRLEELRLSEEPNDIKKDKLGEIFTEYTNLLTKYQLDQNDNGAKDTLVFFREVENTLKKENSKEGFTKTINDMDIEMTALELSNAASEEKLGDIDEQAKRLDELNELIDKNSKDQISIDQLKGRLENLKIKTEKEIINNKLDIIGKVIEDEIDYFRVMDLSKVEEKEKAEHFDKMAEQKKILEEMAQNVRKNTVESDRIATILRQIENTKR